MTKRQVCIRKGTAIFLLKPADAAKSRCCLGDMHCSNLPSLVHGFVLLWIQQNLETIHDKAHVRVTSNSSLAKSPPSFRFRKRGRRFRTKSIFRPHLLVWLGVSVAGVCVPVLVGPLLLQDGHLVNAVRLTGGHRDLGRGGRVGISETWGGLALNQSTDPAPPSM